MDENPPGGWFSSGARHTKDRVDIMTSYDEGHVWHGCTNGRDRYQLGVENLLDFIDYDLQGCESFQTRA